MGIPELVEDGVSGLLVRPGRADALVDALAALAADPALRGAMGAAGRRRVLADFNVDRSAQELERILREALEPTGGTPAVATPPAPPHAEPLPASRR
jgi:glycosyltransferase involved in cell wall biosynthesis